MLASRRKQACELKYLPTSVSPHHQRLDFVHKYSQMLWRRILSYLVWLGNLVFAVCFLPMLVVMNTFYITIALHIKWDDRNILLWYYFHEMLYVRTLDSQYSMCSLALHSIVCTSTHLFMIAFLTTKIARNHVTKEVSKSHEWTKTVNIHIISPYPPDFCGHCLLPHFPLSVKM